MAFEFEAGDYVFDSMRVPGEEVVTSFDYIKYDPRRWRMFPANLYTIGFHIVLAVVVA